MADAKNIFESSSVDSVAETSDPFSESKKAFDHGWDAFWMQKDKHANPYDAHSSEYTEWLRGWLTASNNLHI